MVEGAPSSNMRPANDSLTSCARGRCEPETAPIAMLGVTALALLAARLTTHAVLGLVA